MSGNSYLRDPNNPFFSLEDDIDDETFLRGAPSNNNVKSPTSNISSPDLNQDFANRLYSPTNPNLTFAEELEVRRQELLLRKREIEERTLDSTERSKTYLRETEDIGINTAEELVRQREQLERTERRLDDINNTLRFSQKHIQGIKSVFGGLKNYFGSGKNSEPQPSASSITGVTGVSKSNLVNTLNQAAGETRTKEDEHPVFRLREEEKPKNYKVGKDIAEVLENNLDEMSGSIARLKDLAIGLSEEIDIQNDILDIITDKTERADTSLNRQNKDIRNLLKK